MKTIYERVKSHYFGKGGIMTSPIEKLAVGGAILFWFAAFLTAGFDSTSQVLFVGGFVWFSALALIHLALWIVGSFYKSGFVQPFVSAGIFIFGLISMAILLGVLLFGWVVPSIIVLMNFEQIPDPYNAWLSPLVILSLLVFAIAWYIKGILY